MPEGLEVVQSSLEFFFNESVSQCKGMLSAQYSKDIVDLRRVCENRGVRFDKFDRGDLPETKNARKRVRKWMYEALAREEERVVSELQGIHRPIRSKRK